MLTSRQPIGNGMSPKGREQASQPPGQVNAAARNANQGDVVVAVVPFTYFVGDASQRSLNPGRSSRIIGEDIRPVFVEHQ